MATSKKAPETPVKSSEPNDGFGISDDDRAVLAALPSEYEDGNGVRPAEFIRYGTAIADAARVHEVKLLDSTLPADFLAKFDKKRRRLEGLERLLATVRDGTSVGDVKRLRGIAEKLRSESLAAIEYFLAANPAVLARVRKIREGSDDADLLDDLKKIADLWFEFAAALEKARLPDQVTKLRETASAFEQALAARTLKHSEREVLALRNRAYHDAADDAKAIREAAAWVFRDFPAILAKFEAMAKGRKRTVKKTPDA